MLHDLVFYRRPPGDVALLVDGGQRTISFAQLAAYVERFSAVLQNEGVGPGSVVAVSVADGAAALAALLAIAAAGGVPAPFAAGWWPREARAAAEELAPALIVADSATAPALRDCARLVQLGAGLDGLTCPELIELDGDELRRRVERGDAAALLAPTAGVWGRPRSLDVLPTQLATWSTDPTHRVVGMTVVASELAVMAALRVALCALGSGGSVAFPGTAPRSLERLLHQLGAQERDVDLLWTTGAVANRLAQHLRTRPDPAGAEVGHLEIGQGPLWPGAGQLFRDRLGATLSAGYTLTEAGGFVTRGTTHAGGSTQPLSVGVTCANLSVLVGTPTEGDGFGALSVTGELLGGAARVETGDLGRWQGTMLELAGRAQDRFVVDGEAVWPALVEQALSHHPGVADLAVARRPHPERGSVGVLVMVPVDPENPPFLDDLATHMENLAPHARPLAQAVVDQLPLTPFGQVHRRMLGYEEASR